MLISFVLDRIVVVSWIIDNFQYVQCDVLFHRHRQHTCDLLSIVYIFIYLVVIISWIIDTQVVVTQTDVNYSRVARRLLASPDTVRRHTSLGFLGVVVVTVVVVVMVTVVVVVVADSVMSRTRCLDGSPGLPLAAV